jgi:hypothetical protein
LQQTTVRGVVLGASSCSGFRASLRAPTGVPVRNAASWSAKVRPLRVVCGGLGDFVGGDLLGFDLDKWVQDVEKYGSIAVYAPAEGGYEGRYCTRLKGEGYHFMNISARGLGDPEAYLTKVHGVRPVRKNFHQIHKTLHPFLFLLYPSQFEKQSPGFDAWITFFIAIIEVLGVSAHMDAEAHTDQ